MFASDITPTRWTLAVSYCKAVLENIISGGIVAGDPRAADHVLARRLRVLNGASLQMPGMTGVELSEHVHSHTELSAAHVVILTSMAAHSDLPRLTSSQTESYLPKPVRMRELIRCLERALARPAYADTWSHKRS